MDNIESRILVIIWPKYVSLLDHIAYSVPEISIFNLFYYLMNDISKMHCNFFMFKVFIC